MVARTVSTALERVRNDEYTGSRRCSKCTVANAGLLLAAVALVAAIAPVLAPILAAIGAIQLWLRGYLIPYTPQLVQWSFAAERTPDEPRSDSDLRALEDRDGRAETLVDDLIAEDVLLEAGGGLELSDDFEADLRSRIEENTRRSPDELASRLRTTFDNVDDAWVERRDDRERTWLVASAGDGSLSAETWIRKPLVIVDLAIVETLTTPGRPFDVADAIAVAPAIRTLFDRCPICDATLMETTAGSCCGGPRTAYSPPDLVSYCPSCSVAVAERHA
ncbi:hypothetical protein AB7C87_17705 [Natrarchaeobius sp. A-rgal3]|uniref:hypothetical protein n=1 Tax=Natrarchaeobius versutus TaxID=1679078 RepID=UPI00351042BF